MFVFVSKKQKDLPFSWEDKKDIATGSFKILSFIGFFISLVASTLFSQYLYNASFDSLRVMELHSPILVSFSFL